MEGTSFTEALIYKIENDCKNDTQLISFSRSLPEYLRTVLGEMAQMQEDIDRLEVQNAFLLKESKDQMHFDFAADIEKSGLCGESDESLFKVVGG